MVSFVRVRLRRAACTLPGVVAQFRPPELFDYVNRVFAIGVDAVSALANRRSFRAAERVPILQGRVRGIPPRVEQRRASPPAVGKRPSRHLRVSGLGHPFHLHLGQAPKSFRSGRRGGRVFCALFVRSPEIDSNRLGGRIKSTQRFNNSFSCKNMRCCIAAKEA